MACCQLTVILIGTYERALKEQESVDIAYARLMLLGSAGTGKTCLKRSLMEQPFDPHTTSTIVSDISTVRPFGHEWQTMSDNKWREVTPEDEIEELAYLFKQSQSDKSKTISASSSIVEPITTPATISDVKEKDTIESILVKVNRFHEEKCQSRKLAQVSV